MGNRTSPNPEPVSPWRRFGPPAILAIAGILFVFQNTEQVAFDFFTLSFRMPLWVMLVIFAALGGFIGWWIRRKK